MDFTALTDPNFYGMLFCVFAPGLFAAVLLACDGRRKR